MVSRRVMALPRLRAAALAEQWQRTGAGQFSWPAAYREPGTRF